MIKVTKEILGQSVEERSMYSLLMSEKMNSAISMCLDLSFGSVKTYIRQSSCNGDKIMTIDDMLTLPYTKDVNTTHQDAHYSRVNGNVIGLQPVRPQGLH